MSFAALWPALSVLQGGGEGVVFETKVLFARRRQTLLVPAGDARRAHAAVTFFVANPVWRGLGHLMLLLDRWLPRARLLPAARWEDFPARLLFGAAAERGSACAVLCGSPGPLQKITILCPSQGDAPAQVAKVALRATADDAVALEEHWLRELGDAPEVAPFLPRLNEAGALACGRRFVAMSALPPGHPAFHFGDPHRRFLAAMGSVGRGIGAWSTTDSFRKLRARAVALAPVLQAPYDGLINASLDDVESRIGARALPSCLAHGDFAPWNVRVEGRDLFVFDWEYAHAGANPLQDYFHFHLMSRLARHRPIAPRYMLEVIREARVHARTVLGTRSGVAEAADALAVHYLLDVITFYTEADQSLDPQHPVLRAYLRLLEERAQWLTPASPKEVSA